MEQRTFPIRVWPVEGETLESWLDRYCSTLSTSRRDLYHSAGLRPLGTRDRQSRDYSLRIPDIQAVRIGVATGVPALEIHRLTMSRYEGRALFFRETREGVDIHFLWARGAGTRYCPDCLREASGVWRLAWRLAWSFACTRHRSLLLDKCVGCGLVPGSRTRIGEVPRPDLCDNSVRGSDGHSVPCGTDLSEASTVRLPEGSPILGTQAWLDSAIGSQELGASDLQRLLKDLKMLAGRALRVMSAEDLRRWNRSEDVPGLEFDVAPYRRKTGVFHPASAAVTALSVSLAEMVLRSEDEGVYVPIIRRLLSDRAGNAVKEFPSNFIRQWGGPSPDLERKMLKALHADIGPHCALRYRTAAKSPSPPLSGTSQIIARARSVPQRFWPGWTHLLKLDGPTGPRTLQTALSTGVLLPGYDRRDLTLQREVLGLPQTEQSFTYAFRRLSASTRDTLMLALLRLASYLDEHPAPIDYERRRRLSLDEKILPLPTWHDITFGQEISGNAPDAARYYLAYRITGSLPEHNRGGEHGYFLVQNFVASTPAGILDLLDERSLSFLAQNDVAEPLSWEPPTNLLEDLLTVPNPTREPEPIVMSMISRGLLEPRLIRQAENRAIQALPAHRPGADAFGVRLRRSLDRGASVNNMAVELDKSTRMIRHHVARLGLPKQVDKVQIDPEEVREMYLVQRGTAQEIGDLTGWSRTTIRKILIEAGVTLRISASGKSDLPAIDPGIYSTYPELLKKALIGRDAVSRLQRFALAGRYPSVNRAACELSISKTRLLRQIRLLERDVGGLLLVRAQPNREMHLTDLGRDLVRMGREAGLIPPARPPIADQRGDGQST
jgi:hypothetical protein